MSTIRPTLSEIITRIHNDNVARLDQEELRRSDLPVFERTLAGVSHALYSAIEHGKRQLFWKTAEGSYLEDKASVFGLSRKTATQAHGEVKFTFATGRLVDVPIGTIVEDSNGNQYFTTMSVDINGITTVKAVFAGADYNIEKGVELSLPSPVAGVIKAVTYTAIIGGSDAESDDSLRERGLARTRNPPRQGTASDYVAWAKEVEGVGLAWCYPREQGDGTVVVRFLDDKGGIPNKELLDKVQAHLDSKSSIFGTNFVIEPYSQKFNFTLKIKPDNITIRNLVRETLEKLFYKESVPGGTIYLSHIHAAISAVANEEDHTIVSPTTDIVAKDNYYLPELGDITWLQD